MKRVPLAWYNLLHERNRLGVAEIAGGHLCRAAHVYESGLFGGRWSTPPQIFTPDQFNGDLFLLSLPSPSKSSTTKAFPRERLYQVKGIDGVARAMPLYAEYALWKNPETGVSRALFVYGFNPNDPVFLMPELQDPAGLRALQQPNTTFIDQRSRPEFGPQTIGLETEADRRQITIVGQYSLGGGFAADGTLNHERPELSPLL